MTEAAKSTFACRDGIRSASTVELWALNICVDGDYSRGDLTLDRHVQEPERMAIWTHLQRTSTHSTDRPTVLTLKIHQG